MDPINRRTILTTGAVALAGSALAGEAAQAQAGPKGIFSVATVTIPIVGETDVFPVRRIYCIGRNYAAHSREMGSDPTREPPFFFQKPTDAIQNVKIGEVADHPYPSLTKNYHYEVELVAALKSGGTNIPVDKALDHVYGYAVGLDMTRRDLQRAMGDEKKPWEIGKSFDHAAVIGPIHPVSQDRPHDQGSDLARGQWHREADLRPRQDDLERRRADIETLGRLRAEGRRHHLFRHTGECRPGRERRRAALQDPGLAGHVDQGRLRFCHTLRHSGCAQVGRAD